MRANLQLNYENETGFTKLKYQRKHHIHFQRCQEGTPLLKSFALKLYINRVSSQFLYIQDKNIYAPMFYKLQRRLVPFTPLTSDIKITPLLLFV